MKNSHTSSSQVNHPSFLKLFAGFLNPVLNWFFSSLSTYSWFTRLASLFSPPCSSQYMPSLSRSFIFMASSYHLGQLTPKSIIPIMFSNPSYCSSTLLLESLAITSNSTCINANSSLSPKANSSIFFTRLLITNHYHLFHPDPLESVHSNLRWFFLCFLSILSCSADTVTTKTQALSNAPKLP